MSNPSEVGQTQLQIASSYAAILLITYEHLLTLDTEVLEMWNRKFTATSVLFFVNRYVLLLSTIIIFLEQTGWSGLSDTNIGIIALLMSCCFVRVIDRILMIFHAILGISAAIYAAMRVQALFSRQRAITTLTLLLGLLSPAIITWVWANSVPVLVHKPPADECRIHLRLSDMQYVFLLLGSRIASILADTIVVILTVVKACRIWNIAQQCGGSFTHKIVRIFIQSGVLYFMAMVVLNVLGIVIVSELALDIVVPTWTTAITSIIISRFILELRSAYSDPLREGSSSSLGTDSAAS